VERAAAAGAFERLGERDWHALGTAELLRTQDDGGSWRDARELADTCWALLFLRRGTVGVLTPTDAERAPTTPSDRPGR
jgi:hypothetical protein